MSDWEISVRELAEKLQKPVPERPILLDVRRPEEHRFVALPGSVLIPLHELQNRQAELRAFEGRDVVVYCHHGVRSLQGASLVRSLGLSAVSLRGGIDRWSVELDPTLPRY